MQLNIDVSYATSLQTADLGKTQICVISSAGLFGVVIESQQMEPTASAIAHL